MIAKKCLGQNFLQNPHILSQIVDALSLSPSDRVLEVGPGPSYLTRRIVPHVVSYFAIEIDNQFFGILGSLEKEYPNFHFVIDDFLKVPLRMFISCNKFVGNLPYNISTPILYRIATESKIETLVCMFALGTAERFLANPGTANYSSGTVLAQSFFDVEKIAHVPRTQFNPAPKVDSMILRFTRKDISQSKMIEFNNWVQPFFSYRRKTILNSFIQARITKDIASYLLKTSNISPTERIENLSVEQLLDLFTLSTNKDI
jgi:16S rRNA (adenine1518-N6/adenine1519-N6)-dimethyltransferase